MLRLPERVTWPMVALAAGVTVSGLWVSQKLRERERLLCNLRTYVVAHPEHASVANVIVACNNHVYVDVEACGNDLIQKFGPNVLETLGKMQAGGAFGMPLAPGKR